jgi:hypothetical protein
MLFREKISACCEDHTKHVHSVDRLRSFSVLKQLVHIQSLGFKGLIFTIKRSARSVIQ